MASSSTASLHDHLTTNVLQFLESHPAVTKVDFLERQPVKLRQLTEWEHQTGQQLPHDLRAFYSVTDGFAFTWSIKMKDEVVPLGNMNINSLSQMRQFKMKQFRLCGKYPSPSDDAPSDDEDVYGSSSSNASSSLPFPVAFDLDSTCRDGHVALIYTSPTTSGIYFQDLSSRWYFVANKFIEYQRLMMMHVGIPNWQYAFTDQGMPNETKHWFAFLSPQRLSLDLLHARPTRTPQTGTNASGQRTVPNGNPAHSQQSIDLAKIDALAASITALQPNANLKQKATSVTNGASIGKKATHASGTDDEEEEEEE